MIEPPYRADASIPSKIRRRVVRLYRRDAAARSPARPTISFAFDDAPASAATTAADILEAYGARGSYFVCAGIADQDFATGRLASRAQIVDLAQRGHEIGCHTAAHLDCGLADEAAIRDSLDRNRETLTSWGLQAPTSFAYPYGDVSHGAKRVVAGRFLISRALHHGLVHAGADLNQAPAISLEGPGGEALGQRWIAEARRRNGWVILFTHGVSLTPDRYGITTPAFQSLVTAARALDFDIVTLTEGARRVRGLT